jgi:rhodanese-related sulfurtransferase
MFKWIKGLFKKNDFKALMAQGAVIVDVRTPEEYKGGHIKQSVNIPLSQLAEKLNKLPKNKPVITVCRSGARSGSAKNMLIAKGYAAYNGGPWNMLEKKIAS